MQDSLQALQDRIASLEAENVRLRAVQEAVATANAHSAELMVALEEAKDEVAARNRELQNILDNVQCGFLIVNRDLLISPVVTRSCESLFGRDDVPGGYLPDVLGLDSAGTEALMLGVEEVFADILPEDLTLEQIPRRQVVGHRVLDLAGTVLRDEDGDVEGVLFSVFDVTLLERESKEVELSHALISILRQRDAFRGFVGEAKNLLDTGRQALFHGDETVARRVLHTLKGMFGCYALSDLTALVHDMESEARLPKSAMATVEERFMGFLDAHGDVLQLDLADEIQDKQYTVTEAELRQLVAGASQREAVLAWAQQARGVPVAKVIGPLSALVVQLARRLGKQAELTLIGGDLRVDEDHLFPILRELPHLLRNAIAHGIEPVSQRGDKGATGAVTLAFRERDDEIEVTVADDGAGVDEPRLREAAGARAHGVGNLLDLLTIDGVSTAELSEMAGRGVGVASVRAAAEKAGGHLRVDTELGRGTTFILTVPRAPRAQPHLDLVSNV